MRFATTCEVTQSSFVSLHAVPVLDEETQKH